jgi:hypothetical protein
MLNMTRLRRIIDLMESRFEEWDKDLTLVRVAARELSVAEFGLRHRVGAARRSGHSWAAIGVVLGISEQLAQERFGRPDENTA